MRVSVGNLTFLFMLAQAALPGLAQEPVELKGSWWHEPAQQTRHTTLVASFDSTESNDADYARDSNLSGGTGMEANVPGKHGSATEVAETDGHLHFVGGSNLQAAHGTVRMQVRGDLWADEIPRWLFESRGEQRIGIRREPRKLSLVFTDGSAPSYAPPAAQLDLDIGDVSIDEWHSVVASWDRASATGWLALDGKGVKGELRLPQDQRPAFMVYVAAGADWMSGRNLAGLGIDDFVLYDVPLPLLEAEPGKLAVEDREFLPVVETAARRCLNTIADLQHWGVWDWFYTWPTLLGAEGDRFLSIDKGHCLEAATNFLYAYQILGDYRFLDVAMRTAEFLRAAQDPRGFWMGYYHMTGDGPEPLASDTRIKLQDHIVTYPMYFFCCMHRLTGDEDYLEAAKRAGEFYLAAQNPNGSWSHHYDAQDGVGRGALGYPQAGELNDGATNDGIDAMALMYHLTGDGKYVQAIKRAGDWLVRVQGEDIPLWADQYDSDDRPAWARAFEPPGYGRSGTEYACQALREVYRFSGDERYLEPIRRSVDWMAENLAEGEMAAYIEPGTGRPIAGWVAEGKPGQVYYLDDPEDVAYLETVPIGRWCLEQGPMLGPIQAILDSAADPDAALPPEVTVEGAMELRPPYASTQTASGWRAFVQSFLDSQNEAGVWVSPNTGRHLGEGFQSDPYYVRHLLYYIEHARIALGEIEPMYRGGGNLLKMAYPYADWYEVNWEVNTE